MYGAEQRAVIGVDGLVTCSPWHSHNRIEVRAEVHLRRQHLERGYVHRMTEAANDVLESRHVNYVYRCLELNLS